MITNLRSLSTSQIDTVPKRKVTHESRTLSLSTSQIDTVPKQVGRKVVVPAGLSTSQIDTVPKLKQTASAILLV